MSHTSRVPVSYVKSTACVIVPPNEQGWEVIPDTWDCNVSVYSTNILHFLTVIETEYIHYNCE